jgi:hypothetical protein
MANLVLWFVNRVVGWNEKRLRAALESAGHRVRLGNRNDFNAMMAPQNGALEISLPGELMHEGYSSAVQHVPVQRNEYFVPFFVKCLGDVDGFASRNKIAPSKTDAWKAVETQYRKAFVDAGAPIKWISYWDAPPVGAMRMNTPTVQRATPREIPAYLGIYEIMKMERSQDEHAVIVGYSQGGVVARYLAFIDSLTTTPFVKAVVTAHSPNWGSPVARYDNRQHATAGAYKAVAGLLGMPTPSISHQSAVFKSVGLKLDELVGGLLTPPTADPPGPRRMDIEAVAALLRAAIEDFDRMSPYARTSNAATIDLVDTALKWTGALENKFGSAFNDLSIGTISEEGRVLHDINNAWPETVLAGAILGGNFSLKTLVRSMVSGLATLCVDGLIGQIRENLTNAQEAWRDGPMTEHDVTKPGAHPVSTDYLTAVHVHTIDGQVMIPERSHDFLVPTTYQSLGPRWLGSAPKAPPKPSWLVGNLFNEDAAHLSGAELSDQHPNNEDLAVDLLKAISSRI